MSGCVSKLIGPGNIATGMDIGENSAQIVVDHKRPLGSVFKPEIFQPQARCIGLAPHCHQQLVKADCPDRGGDTGMLSLEPLKKRQIQITL